MKLSLILFIAGMAVVLFVAAGPVPGSASGNAGEAIFKENCMACHPGGGNVVKPDKPMKGAPQLKQFGSFLTWIRNPVQPMPPFSPATISDDQAKKLYEYILKQEKEGWK
jgi:mono/diheme cytochrome c family protein